MGQSVSGFMDDNDEMWPRHNRNNAVWRGRWYAQLLPYTSGENGYTFDGFRCPSKNEKELIWYDSMYAQNQEISCQDNPTNKVFSKAWAWHSLKQVRSPHELVMWSEGRSATFSWRRYGRMSEVGPGSDALNYGYAGTTRSAGIQPYHQGNLNYMHADGHVSLWSVDDWSDVETFTQHAIKNFHPAQSPLTLSSGPPPGMEW